MDSNDIDCTCCINIKSTKLPKLFDNPGVSSVSVRPEGDDKLYGITVNILPYHMMNRKRWFTYQHDKQREILARVEAAFRRNQPDCRIIEIHYEICPTEKDFHNVHFHALYRMPGTLLPKLQQYYDRICTDKSNLKWRHIDIKEINNKEAWLLYIRKDMLI